METIILEVKNKADIKFWLNLAKKTGTRAFVTSEKKALLGEIEESLEEVRKMQEGALPKRSMKKMLDEK